MKRKENTVNRKRKAGIFVSIILLLTLIGGGGVSYMPGAGWG